MSTGGRRLLLTTMVSGASGVAFGVALPLTSTVTVAVSGSSDGMSKLFVNRPMVVGEKRTVTIQLVAGDKVWSLQVSDTNEKGAAGGKIVPIAKSAPPALLTFTDRFVAEPTSLLPKSSEVGVATIF